ncbi:hypothetical protein B0T09DRAFT_19929 [Sordaria sp. MPI-SDFR-AT-0083]|nr:hypothetical protein B0T09DRAFT_19929 [Sordaria sp. MPI-SDFR-AT-0083]
MCLPHDVQKNPLSFLLPSQASPRLARMRMKNAGIIQGMRSGRKEHYSSGRQGSRYESPTNQISRKGTEQLHHSSHPTTSGYQHVATSFFAAELFLTLICTAFPIHASMHAYVHVHLKLLSAGTTSFGLVYVTLLTDLHIVWVTIK